jgi:diguanylate cyclase (GGDEF)-like protein
VSVVGSHGAGAVRKRRCDLVMTNVKAVEAPQSEGHGDQSRRRAWVLVACTVLLAGLALSAAGALLWRSSERQQERVALRTTASDVTDTLGTLLRRNADFVATLRSVLTMQPRLSPTGFNTWYTTLQGRERQVGSIGSAVVASVPAAQVTTFALHRDADPAFRALLGRWLTPVKRGRQRRYCLLSEGEELVPLTSLTAGLVQEDWCLRSSTVGLFQSQMLQVATDSNQFLTLAVDLPSLHTTFLEAAFYRRGAPLSTVAERRAAVAGWLVSSFNMPAVISAAIGNNHGLRVELYHTNPGEPSLLAGSAGPSGRAGQLAQKTTLSIDGTWTVDVRGAPVVSGLSANTQGVVVFIAGAVLSLLLFLLVVVLSRARDRALALVAEKTGQLRHQALYDSLTGLPNRVLALDRAEQMLARGRRIQVPVAALYVDIDGFKHVNDTFGHAAGDEFLKIVAGRLQSVIRESDTGARLAGDEFLVLLEGSSLDAGPELVAERLLDVLREPYDMNDKIGRHVSLTASIGIAYGQRATAEEMLADADVALYAAKAEGKNRFALFESGMQTAVQDRLTLEMDLTEALESGELFLVYQPMFDLQSGSTIGAEALLRWRHPTRGVIQPDVFIPIAEESGLIVAIGRWVLKQACKQGARWRAQGHQIGISVNVSGRQLDRDELIDDVRDALHSAGLEPSALILEITETTLMRDADATARRLVALKELGVNIAIDDFGTGYSSLAYLRQFPVDALKIDRSFIQGIAGSEDSAALIHTLVRLGKSLNLQTLAEGIETNAQLTALQHEQCDHGQGFLYARPLDAQAIDEFLNSNTATDASHAMSAAED